MKKRTLLLFVLLVPVLPLCAQYAVGLHSGINPSFGDETQALVYDAGLNACVDLSAQTFVPSLTLCFSERGVQSLLFALDYWFTNPRIFNSLFKAYVGAGSGVSVNFTDYSAVCSLCLRALVGTEFCPVMRLGVFVQLLAQPQLTFDSKIRFSFSLPLEVGVRFWF